MSRTRSTIMIETPFLLTYVSENAAQTAVFATLDDFNTAITNLGYAEYIGIKPTLIKEDGVNVDVSGITIDVVLRLDPSEKTKLCNSTTGVFNGGLTGITDSSFWYVKKTIEYTMIDGTHNYKDHLAIPDGHSSSETLVEIFNAITSETDSHTDDQETFNALYEYVMFSIAFYISSSKTWNPYLYNYILQMGIEHDSSWDTMRQEFDDNPTRVILSTFTNPASEEATWYRFIASYSFSQSTCPHARLMSNYIIHSLRAITSVKDTTGVTKGKTIQFINEANTNGRVLGFEDITTTLSATIRDLYNSMHGINNSIIRLASAVNIDLSSIATGLNSAIDSVSSLEDIVGVNGVTGDDLLTIVRSLRAQLSTIYSTLRLSQS